MKIKKWQLKTLIFFLNIFLTLLIVQFSYRHILTHRNMVTKLNLKIRFHVFIAFKVNSWILYKCFSVLFCFSTKSYDRVTTIQTGTQNLIKLFTFYDVFWSFHKISMKMKLFLFKLNSTKKKLTTSKHR